ncbi:uncharacterized protein LOC135395906 [Ornithodoros turicata]|uniref:uncharacterized protein LOC135395906 n=1 Tax=Ornithodoros turicata TaxID=34597 RepID=UPI0031386DA7
MNAPGRNARGPPRKQHGDTRRKNKRVSPQDRWRIIDCARRGGDLIQLAEMLEVNIKTARSIVITDREETKKRGGAITRYGDEIVRKLKVIVDENASLTLVQIRDIVTQQCPGVTISTSSVNRLLDGHGYTIKLLSCQPVDRNRPDVKEHRKQYATWLQREGPQLLRYYVDETNFNIWCSRSYGRSQRGTKAVRRRVGSKGANINLIACMSSGGLLHWQIVDKVSWQTYNEFIAEASRLAEESEPNEEAVFLMDNAPAHKRVHDASLSTRHSTKYLPPYSPFLNPIEEMFSKFKLGVKSLLTERQDEILARPQDMTIREYRRNILLQVAEEAMRKIQRSDCAAYDRNHFKYLDDAMNGRDM